MLSHTHTQTKNVCNFVIQTTKNNMFTVLPSVLVKFYKLCLYSVNFIYSFKSIFKRKKLAEYIILVYVHYTYFWDECLILGTIIKASFIFTLKFRWIKLHCIKIQAEEFGLDKGTTFNWIKFYALSIHILPINSTPGKTNKQGSDCRATVSEQQLCNSSFVISSPYPNPKTTEV